jgi:protein-L-isoaspartate(D-aspartate) O-methyltransferase
MLATISEYCEHLVETIEVRLGRPLAPAIRSAFLETPRHLFVPAYYDREHVLHTAPAEEGASWQEWLASIYADEALVTQIDARGLPASSSSQPSIMACMLEALGVQSGQRVLEIGTGSGYNAALLAHLAGSPRLVTSIDLAPDLVVRARPLIEAVVGPGMHIIAGDGLAGYAPTAPYDRIIVTGSFLPVALAWVQQLAPGGRLVMNLRGRLAGGLLTLDKREDGSACGTFAPGWKEIGFMRLRESSAEPVTVATPAGYERWPIREQVLVTMDDPAYACAAHFGEYQTYRGHDFTLWLQWAFPGLGVKWIGKPNRPLSPLLVDGATQTVLVIEPREAGLVVTVRGQRALWSDLLSAWQEWQQCGRPGEHAYRLLIAPDGGQRIEVLPPYGTYTFVLAAGSDELAGS